MPEPTEAQPAASERPVVEATYELSFRDFVGQLHSGGSRWILLFFGIAGGWNLALAAWRPADGDPLIRGLFFLGVVGLMYGKIWWQYWRLAADQRTWTMRLFDDRLFVRDRFVTLEVPWSDLTAVRWSPHGVTPYRNRRALVFLPKRALGATGELLLRERLRGVPRYRSRVIWIVLLWVFLVLAFVVMWNVFGHRAASSPHDGEEVDVNDEFWSIIDSAQPAGDAVHRLEAIEARLVALPPNRIVGFQRKLDEAFAESYTEELWGAAYLINGGCSDDGFEYFRGWLITLGRDRFRAAVRSPDSLAEIEEIVPFETELEDMLYVAMKAYEHVTGGEMPEVDRAVYPPIEFSFDFEDEDEMQRRYPRLYQRFGSEQR